MIAWRLEVAESLPSTSDALIARAKAGEPGGAAIMARLQTKGRGSRGRGWTAPPGNLNLSLLLRPEAGLPIGAWALLAGLALHDALSPHASPAALWLKWPNDLMCKAGKLAGVLVDAAARPERGAEWVVLGMGVNLASAPAVPDRRLACLADLGSAMRPDDLAPLLLERVAVWAERSFAAIREAWMARAHPLGTLLRLTAPDVSGRFAGLDGDGGLRLEMEGGIRSFRAGEVFPMEIG